jgi:hypothetical protein
LTSKLSEEERGNRYCDEDKSIFFYKQIKQSILAFKFLFVIVDLKHQDSFKDQIDRASSISKEIGY